MLSSQLPYKRPLPFTEPDTETVLTIKRGFNEIMHDLRPSSKSVIYALHRVAVKV